MRRQSWMYRGLIVAGLVLGLALPAQAALVGLQGRLEATPGGGDYQAYYDPHQEITWAADANLAQTSEVATDGLMTWSAANAWAASLTLGGVSGWRLPTADPPCGSNSNCTDSEMGYLFYTALVNTAGALTNTGPFSNVQANGYWSELASSTSDAWGFDFGNGNQGVDNKDEGHFVWVVRTGDVPLAAVPAPSAMLLMGSGLIGLLAWRRFGRGC